MNPLGDFSAFFACVAGFLLGFLIFLIAQDVQKQYEFSDCEEIKAQCREVLLNKVNQGGCE